MRYWLERLLIISTRPTFVVCCIVFNATWMITVLALWTCMWVYGICAIGCVLVVLDVKYLIRIRSAS